MTIQKRWMLAILFGAVAAGSACTQRAADDTTHETATTADKLSAAGDKALDATKEGAAAVVEGTKEAVEKTADAANDLAQKTGDKAREIADAVESKTKQVVSSSGEAITDGWITTKVSAAFVNETLLKGSDINVDTTNHEVTLKGTVGSDAAKARAAAIALNIEGVSRVVNQLVVT